MIPWEKRWTEFCFRRLRKSTAAERATEWLTDLEYFRKWQQSEKLTRMFESKMNGIQWDHHVARTRLRTSTEWDGGGTSTARGNSPEWGVQTLLQVAEHPQGVGMTMLPQWGHCIPFESRGSWHSMSPGTRPRPLPNNLPCRKSCGSQAPGTQGSAIQDNCSANNVPRESTDLAIQT